MWSKYDIVIVHMLNQAFSKQPLTSLTLYQKTTPKQVLAQF